MATNILLDAMRKKQTQSQQAASSGIGRSIDSQQEAWSQSLRDQPSTFKAQSLETEDTTPKTTNPLLTFTDDWKKQQEEKSKPKKKGLFGITIPDGSENPWDYDATANIIDTSVPATPKVEEPKPAEPEQPKSKPLEYSDAFLKQEEQKDAWSPTWENTQPAPKTDWKDVGNRAWNTVKGAGKQIGSSFTNTLGTYFDFMGENGFASNLAAGQMRQNALANPFLIADEDYQSMIGDVEREGDATVKQAANDVFKIADDLGESAQADINAAKDGLSKFGQAGIDIGTNIIQMGSDAALGWLTGGSSLIPLALRVFGQSAQEARQEGASTNQQVAYALTNTGIEILTEKMADGLAGIYGKGAADEVAEETIRRLAQSDTGRTLLRFLYGAHSEGFEEVVSDLLNPYAKMIYNDKSFAETFGDGYDPSEILYDYLIGAALGGLGGTVNTIKGGNVKANAALAGTDAVQQMLTNAGLNSDTAMRLAPIVEKATSGEELTKREKNALLEFRNREDVAAGSSEAVNILNEVLAAQGVETPATPVGQSPSKTAQLETALDTAEQNQVNANVETAAPAEEAGKDVSKRARLETELDTAQENQTPPAPLEYEGGSSDDVMNNVAAAIEAGNSIQNAIQPFISMIRNMTDEALRKFKQTGLNDYIAESFASLEHEAGARQAETALADAVTQELNSRDGAVLENGRTYTPQEMLQIFNKANKIPALSDLAQKVFAVAEKLGITGDVTTETPYVGVYDDMHRSPTSIAINPNILNGLTDAGRAQTVLHEYIHGVTSYIMTEVNKYSALFNGDTENAPDWYKQNVTPEMEQAVKTIFDVYTQLSNDPTFRPHEKGTFSLEPTERDTGHFYAAENPYEMIAELSDPNFRSYLQGKNLWQTIVDAIKKLFGITSDNALDTLSTSLDYILSNASTEAFNQYGTDITQSDFERAAHTTTDVTENPLVNSVENNTTEQAEQNENPLLTSTGVTPLTQTNNGVNPNKAARIETELDRRSERIAEIRQEIADLEQQAPSAERDAEIRNLIEEQTSLENGETAEEATTQEPSENAAESQEVSGNENIPAESEENLKNDLEGNAAEETSQQTATEGNAGTATEDEAGSQANTEQQNAPSEPFIPKVNQEAQGGKTRVSETSTNTLANVAEQNGGTQAPITYLTQTEAQTLNEAMNRVDTNMVEEMNGLSSKETWTATDIDTALTIQSRIMFDAVKSGDYSAAEAWAKVVQQHGTEAARALQALGKWARTGSAAYADAINQIDKADNLTDEQKTNLKKQVGEFAQQYDSVEDGDFDGLISLILKQNGVRKTGTFADGNFEKILRKIKDYNWLKEYALRQLMSIPADYTDTATFAQKAKTWQVNSQLTRLGTFFRNLGGNASFGVLDIFSQDGFGYAIDSLLSKITGRKEVGFDKGWLSRKARSAAVDAANKSILEIAGDVDMGRDTSKYGTTSNRTNKMVGDTQFERFMSRWEQLLGYSLNTSDRFFRGQLEQSYAEALQQQVEQGNMTQAEAEKLAQMMADYRLFQNEGLAAKFSKGAHNVLNLFGFGGEVRGAERQGGFGLGDLVNPYPGVPANLAVKLLEYSPANIAKGGLEIVKLIRDAKNGKTVTGHQMQAAMDVARGLTGMGVVALFSALAKSGLFRNSDDEEDYDVMTAQGSQGLSGVQWNLDATVRSLSGGKADWKDGDTLMKVSWLEPINAFMAVASLIADEEDDADLATKAGDYMQGAIQAFLDLPVMENIQNTVNTFKYATGDNIFDRAGQGAAAFAGGALSGMIPAPISQLARVTDDYYRDTSGITKAEAAVNSLLNSIPGARNTLPVKTDNFGNEKLNEPNALLRTLNSFVLPGAINTFMQTDVQEAVAEVYEATGKASVYPDRKGVKNLSYEGKQYDLTEEEQKAYHETAGQKSEQYISAFINSDYYDDLTDEQRADIITALNSDAKDYAKYEYLKGKKVDADNPETEDQAAMTALKTLGNKANGSFKSGKETDYETLDYIVKNIYPNLTKAEKDALNSAGSYGRYDNMYDCSKVGIDSKTFEKFLNKAKEIDKNSHSYTINAEEYAAYVDKQKGLTSAQRSALKDIYKYTTTLVADTKTYDKWVNAGLSYDDAVGFNKKIDTNGNNSKTNQEIFAAIEQYAKDAEMAEKLWEAANSSSWSKSGKSYFQANPSSKFRSSWSGKTYSTPGKSSSSSSSSSSGNPLLKNWNGGSSSGTSTTSSGSSSSGNILLNNWNKG